MARMNWQGLMRIVPVLPLLVGPLLAAASLTPSLIPRGTFFQGVLAGASMAMGHMLTQFVLALWRSLEIPVLRGRWAVAAHVLVAVPVLATLFFCIAHARGWQNGLRERMGLPELEVANTLQTAVIALAVFLVLYVIGLLIQGLFNLLRRRLARHIPVRSANVLGLLLCAILVLIVTRDGMVHAGRRMADSSYAAQQYLTHPETPPTA